MAPIATAENGAEIYQKLLPKTVWVVVDHGALGKSTGTGFVVGKYGKTYYVMTNHHVVRNPESPNGFGYRSTVSVYHPRWSDSGDLITSRERYLQSDWQVKATVLFTDSQSDLAILGINGYPPPGAYDSNGEIVTFEKVYPGDRVYSVGNPASVQGLWSFSSGEVRQCAEGGNCKKIETTSPINPGDSGGPLVDAYGNFVGVNVSYTVQARLVSQAIAGSEANIVLSTAQHYDWVWFDNSPRSRTSSYPTLINYFEAVGNYSRASKKAAEYVERLKRDGSDYVSAQTRATRLLNIYESSSQQNYVKFLNKCSNSRVEVEFQFYGAQDGITYRWSEWQKLVLQPGASQFITSNNQTAALVHTYRVRAKALERGITFPYRESRANDLGGGPYSFFGVTTPNFICD